MYSTNPPESRPHHTEVDGWLAQWRLDGTGIRIILVRKLSEEAPLMWSPIPATAPDLAQMRERFPRLSHLWDAIRHEYWSEHVI